MKNAVLREGAGESFPCRGGEQPPNTSPLSCVNISKNDIFRDVLNRLSGFFRFSFKLVDDAKNIFQDL